LTSKEHADKGLYKIGMTKNLNSRLKYYKTAFASKVDVISCRYTVPMKLVERVVKYLLKDNRHDEQGGTEWFYTRDPDSYTDLIEDVCMFIENRKPRKSCCTWLLEWLYIR
jgi:hypothetical protein